MVNTFSFQVHLIRFRKDCAVGRVGMYPHLQEQNLWWEKENNHLYITIAHHDEFEITLENHSQVNQENSKLPLERTTCILEVTSDPYFTFNAPSNSMILTRHNAVEKVVVDLAVDALAERPQYHIEHHLYDIDEHRRNEERGEDDGMKCVPTTHFCKVTQLPHCKVFTI